MRTLFSFPNPVNEVAARVVATGVVVLAVLYVATGWLPLLLLLAYGFLARVLTGPTLSPLGQLATRVVAPRLTDAPRLVPGAPKRFAQGVGVAFTLTALLLATVAGAPDAARIVIALLAGAAALEAFAGFCLGCKVFALLMRVGVIPERVCAECNDLRLPRPALLAPPGPPPST